MCVCVHGCSTQLWMGTLLCVRLGLFACAALLGGRPVINNFNPCCHLRSLKRRTLFHATCVRRPRVIWNVTFRPRDTFYDSIGSEWRKQRMIYVSANQIKVNPIAGKVYFRCNQMLSGPKMQQATLYTKRLTRGRKLGGRRLSNLNFLIHTRPSISLSLKLARLYLRENKTFWEGISPNRRTSALLINLSTFPLERGHFWCRFPPCVLCPSQTFKFIPRKRSADE